ncbi:MAG: hypothetical protein DI563_11035 [Variovorax paradoxus]|uniref:Uncharacterized protein n=1 Tax=Variovorax paradoxus TaxID=34073 RepID=A0A2W5QC23_VARPD|nr:MAG: hypothetical protein DI563_11035 [Variovorax paradoxus]
MNSKTPKAAAQPLYSASDKPGGFLPSAELDRANTFAVMRLALEGVLSADRSAVAGALRAAVEGYSPEFRSHAEDLTASASLAEVAGHTRKLESAIADKVAFFKSAESGTLATAPRRASEVEIHARELLRTTTAAAESYRVRHNNY